MSKNKGEFTVSFRGVRGNYPVSSSNTLKYGGNTACVEVRVNGHLIILDAGTGIINLGNDLVKYHIASGTEELNRKPVEAVVLVSHLHIDHIQGFPFFKPAYLETSKIYMYGSKYMEVEFNEIFSTMFTPFFPLELGEMAAQLYINSFRETDMMILHPGRIEPEIRRIDSCENQETSNDTVIITCLKSFAHPKDGVLVFKISWKGHSLVYATDKESYVGGDSRLISFARNADLLIHDAQYIFEDYTSLITPKQGFGHSTPEMAAETAELANVRKLVLYHHDPAYNDIQLEAIGKNSQKQFQNTITAYEGLEINLLDK